MSTTDPFGLLGQVLDGQYRVDALAGEGGFGAVYRGTHLGLEEPIAIKCLKLTGAVAKGSAAESFLQRFRDEGRILYRLSQGNLNVVRCIASGSTISPMAAIVPYLVLEWLEGRSLADDFEERRARGLGGRALPEVITLLEGAADAIAYAHAQGVVHRDLNPGNIFLAKQRDGSVRTKVLDFGVAKVIGDDLELGPRSQTLGNIRIFSPAYAAPEQFDAALAPPGPYTDVYTLALVTTELLIGRHVAEGDTLAVFLHKTLDPNFLRTPRALGATVTPAVEAVFTRALSIDTKRRQRDAGQLWSELRAAASAEDLAATVRTANPVEPDAPRGPNLAEVKQTARMPNHAALFQPPAVRPPPGTHVPEPSVSVPAVQLPTPPPQGAAGPRPAAGVQSSSARATWIVGAIVFVVVLLFGGALLRFLLTR